MNDHRKQKLCLPLFFVCALALAAVARGQALSEQCEALAEKPEATAEVTRLLAALKDKESKARLGAAQQLGKSCDQRAVNPLINLLKDPDPLVRIAAVEALGQLGDRSSVEPLIDASGDEEWRVRQAIGRALCAFQYYPASYAALNKVANPQNGPLGDEGDIRARCATVIAINQLRDVRFSRKAVQFLFAFLDDQRQIVRQIAEQAMLELKNTRNGSHELIGLLKQSNNPQFREKAAYWLGKLGVERARPALGEASVGDQDIRVQQAAKEALALIKKQADQQ